MPSKTAEPRSISAQLVLLFTLAAAFVLSCALIVFYWIVVQHAIEEDNAVLNERIRVLTALLQEPTGVETISQQLTRRHSSEVDAEWIRILDQSSRPIAVSPGMDRVLPANLFPPPGKLRSPINYASDSHLFALESASLSVSGQNYVIQFAQDRSADERFRQKFGTLLAISVALGTIASAAIAVTVTRRGLRPLREMRDVLRKITPTHLDARLDPVKWPQELQPVAVAFDQMLERLENSFTRLSQFSADLAHELRTPIGNMLGESQVALTRGRTAEEYRHVIESSVVECERLSAIVDNLLFLARAESAESPTQTALFDARPVIEKIANYYQTLADDRHIAIGCEGNAKVYADQALFERTINNLVENALRFTPDNGKIQILVKADDGQTSVAVRDNGCGIAPEHLSRVFDRFYRVDPARNAGGAGLGLSLVKSILELHGGTATAQSDTGRGTTITLRFPAES